MNALIAAAYYASLAGLALCSLQRAWLARRVVPSSPAPLPATLPRVTVQLPIFNEASVAERLIHAATSLRWPGDLLEIQVLDDSTDETTAVIRRMLQRHPHVRHIHRTHRSGFKAGALQHGLSSSKGELIAIFDADFIPPPDFLERLVGHFSDASVGLVQARWEHLNDDSLLTHVQAMMLDAHFSVEQAGRAARGACFNFNGTAGIWRRTAIEDAGGWRPDTLTEDLDLSYRAQLRGWKFHYAHDVTAPAELPAQMTAFKGQQHRWTKGSMQTARALLPAIWRSAMTTENKLHAGAHLLGNLAYPLLLVTALLLPLRRSGSAVLDGALWLLGTGALSAFYLVSARRCGRSVVRTALRIPALMALGAGMSLSNARGVVAALLGIPSAFIRTPKQGSSEIARYRARIGLLPIAEFVLGCWLLQGARTHFLDGNYATLPVQLVFAAGMFWVSLGALRQLFTSNASPVTTEIHAAQVLQAAGSQTPPGRQTA